MQNNIKIQRSLNKQKAVCKCAVIKVGEKVDISTKYNLRTWSVETEQKITQALLNYHLHGLMIKNAMLYLTNIKETSTI